MISRHTVVCRVAQENGACANGVSIKILVKFLRFFLLPHFAHFAKIAIACVIWLKFGTCIGGLKANASIKFWVNLINIEEVISDFTR